MDIFETFKTIQKRKKKFKDTKNLKERRLKELKNQWITVREFYEIENNIEDYYDDLDKN